MRCIYNINMLSTVKIKWNKSDYNLEVDLGQDLRLLRAQLFSLTGPPR